MPQMTCKELSALSDLLTMEENLIAKYKAYASEMTDTLLRTQFEQISAKHQSHYNSMVSNLR